MKKIISVLLVVPFLAFQCHKDNDKGELLEGKVVRLSCASYVVQILNNASIGEDGWKDILDHDKVYDDVINASNQCEIPESIKTGNVIQFRIVNPSTYKNCYVCFLYDAPPSVKYEIRNIRLKH